MSTTPIVRLNRVGVELGVHQGIPITEGAVGLFGVSDPPQITFPTLSTRFWSNKSFTNAGLCWWLIILPIYPLQ
jgi:hypothetical protein